MGCNVSFLYKIAASAAICSDFGRVIQQQQRQQQQQQQQLNCATIEMDVAVFNLPIHFITPAA